MKKDYRLEEYVKIVRNPAHRISITKLRLGVHTLRIQTGKYENKGASIPVEEALFGLQIEKKLHRRRETLLN